MRLSAWSSLFVTVSPSSRPSTSTSLRRSDVVKALCTLLNRTLTPDHDTEAICCKASNLLGFLWRGSSGGLSIYFIFSLQYRSHLRPIIEYA